MPCPKLTPLQARFAASFAATLFLLFLYFVVSSPRLAYAIDVDSITRRDHNHPISPRVDLSTEVVESDWRVDSIVDRDIAGRGQSSFLNRAPAGTDALANNEPRLKNIDVGETQHWMVSNDAIRGPKSPSTPGLPKVVEAEPTEEEEEEDRLTLNNDEEKRDEGSSRAATVYITANTCLQPSLNATQHAKHSGAPQLKMYISLSDSNKQPGPGTSGVIEIEFDDGYAYKEVKVEDKNNIYIGISAPKDPNYSGRYNYEIAASIDAYYHDVESKNPFLLFIDSDSEGAFLSTDNATQARPDEESYKDWMKLKPPWTMFAHPMNDSSILGIQKSYCGLSKNALISKSGSNVHVGMTNRGLNRKPKQQFYVRNLNHSSNYYGILAMDGNSTKSGSKVVGGGGKVWASMNFTTKSDKNCAILYDLKFCDEVAYAVPSNPSLSHSKLGKLYDDYAAAIYQNFTYSLQQIPCEAPASQQYSLARNCTQCAMAYKQWLCAVTIPRCQDFSSTRSFLRPRNTGQKFINGSRLPDGYGGLQNIVSNTSRNPMIDTKIRPGPYKEILPCQDLCHTLVQACPAKLGFQCPVKKWLNDSYGYRSDGGDITCSYLGAAYFLNDAGKITVLFTATIALGFWSLSLALGLF